MVDKSLTLKTYKHLGCKQRSCIVKGVVSKSVQENRLKVNRSELVNTSLGFLAVQQSCRVGDSIDSRVSKLISDHGGRDKLKSLIFAIV